MVNFCGWRIQMLRQVWPLLLVSCVACGALPFGDEESDQTDSGSLRIGDTVKPREEGDDERAERATGATRPQAPGERALVSDCGVGEREPNDTRDGALPYEVGTAAPGCIASNQDVDFYEFSTPDDNPAGGYVQFTLTDVGQIKVGLTLYSTADNAIIGSGSAGEPGAVLDFFVAVAPLATYRVAISGAGTDLSRYTLTSKYTRIDDPHEPNDTQDQAAPISAGEPVDAYFFGFYEFATIGRHDFIDWYVVALQDGPADILLTEVSLSEHASVSIHDLNGRTIAAGDSQNDGANAMVHAMVGAGSYLIQAQVYGGEFRDDHPRAVGVSATLPDHFTRRYILTVDQ
jgi:hypothetical protein